MLAEYELFGVKSADVYVPSLSRVHRVDGSALSDLGARQWTQKELGSRLLALRILSLAAGGAPIAAGNLVELLPHQTSILHRALKLSPVRLAICCEVGLGKTTTAGAVISELLARDRIGRVLVVAPKGVQLQWVAEMRNKFGLDFVRIGPEGVPIDSAPELWRAFNLVVTSVDAIKPLRRRTGWSRDRIDGYNSKRIEAVASATWDLVVIDEAHHVAGSAEDVARHRLATILAGASPNLLLLSATPHSGKSESFRRFLSLVDPDFAAGREMTASTVKTILARTEKRTAVDSSGRPLFRPRTTELCSVAWTDHPEHRRLYEAVSDYVRQGYLESKTTGDNATGFLMLLFQRLVASSAAAVLAALERRRAAIIIRADEKASGDTDLWDELDASETQLFVEAPVRATDVGALDTLIQLALTTLSAETDPKAQHFLRVLNRLRHEEENPAVKVLVFTQFRATQRMIVRLLEGQGISTETVDGDMGLAERASAQEGFRTSSQVLVSTDAGGEGVNLQFAHVVVNWDLPWSPTLLEQRVGRVDRIGQQRVVRAFNFVLNDSVDQRVLEVLEDKLERILSELGADKRSDVLSTADQFTEDLYVSAIVDPSSLDLAASRFKDLTMSELDDESAARAILKDVTATSPPVSGSPLPELLSQLQGLVDCKATDALKSPSVVVPGEPVPVVRGSGVSAWLAVGRITTQSCPQLPGSFAVLVDDAGRVNAIGGGRQLEVLAARFGALSDAPTGGIETVPLSDHLHELLMRALVEYSYHHLKLLADGAVPTMPDVRLALALRLEP